LDAVDVAAAEIAYRVPLAAAADLVHHEARLLDQQRFGDWIELFTDDARYWIAAGHHVATPDETRDPLVLARDGLAEQFPPPDNHDEPQTCRLVSDVHPEEVGQAWDDAPPCHIVVGSTFSLAVVDAGGDQTVLHGWARHGLRRGEDRRLRIAAKRVTLLGSAQKTQQNRPFPL
jgi:hypothetical protein